MTYWHLIAVFTVLSILGFGGGKAIIPQMHNDVVLQYHWVTSGQFARFFAISKLAPGATNSIAALVGFSVAGFLGAAVATLAVFLPSSALVYGVGMLWHRFREHAWRNVVARSLAPVVIGLSWAGIVSVAQGALTVWWTYLIAAGAAVVVLRSRHHPGLILLASGIAGALVLR